MNLSKHRNDVCKAQTGVVATGNFHKRLKETREKRGVSIRRLCRDLRIHKSTYENWEFNVYPSRPEQYRKLAEYLEVPLEYLMFGERKNDEWERAVFHLRNYVEEVVRLTLQNVPKEVGKSSPMIPVQKIG